MLTKKSLVSALIAVGALGAVAAPLPSSAADFGFSISTTPVRHDSYYGRDRHYQPSRFDRDGDGIPNRFDRTPDGYRHGGWGGGGGRMSDRDRDGVPDRYDNYPNNPRWR